MNCSDDTAADVDTEVMKLLKDSYKEAKKLLKENRKLLDKLAEFLIEKETITGKEFMKIFRKEKGLPEPEEKKPEEKKPEEKKPEQAPVRPGAPGFHVPGNYGRPPIPPVGGFRQGIPTGNPGMPPQGGQGIPTGNPGIPPQGNPYQNGLPVNPQGNQNIPQGNQGIPQRNPYQNGQGFQGPENAGNRRKEEWDAQYRQNHWTNQPDNGNSRSGNIPRGAFSGMPQDTLEKPEDTFAPYMTVEKPESKPELGQDENTSEKVIADKEQDAEIVLEAAEKVMEMEEKGEKDRKDSDIPN